ncbi:MAG: reverse transcriptase domain-containing protein [Luteolibacter sp.]|uniref:reverse transcriptase domain-containing protein n=1 Tax=Luteolibacter sp. TaxID=1962973 RepID=UPI003265275C
MSSLRYLHWKLLTDLQGPLRDEREVEKTTTRILHSSELEELVKTIAWQIRRIAHVASYDPGWTPGIPTKIVIQKDNGKTRTAWSPSNEDYVQQLYLLHGVVKPIVEANLSEQSHAFRSGHSTDTATGQVILAVKRLAGQNIQINQEDFTDCFTTAPTKLVGHHFPKIVTGRIDAIQGRYREVTMNEAWTPGLPQGFPLVPAIINLIIDKLIDPIRKRWKVSADIIVYADDITIIAPRGTARQIKQEMIEALSEHGMRLNRKKSRRTVPRLGNWLPLLGLEIEWDHASATPTIRPRGKAYSNLSEKLADAVDINEMNGITRGWRNAYIRCNDPHHPGKTTQAIKEGFLRRANRPQPRTR